MRQRRLNADAKSRHLEGTKVSLLFIGFFGSGLQGTNSMYMELEIFVLQIKTSGLRLIWAVEY